MNPSTILVEETASSEPSPCTEEDVLARWGAGVTSGISKLPTYESVSTDSTSGQPDKLNKTGIKKGRMFGETQEYLAFVRKEFSFGIGPEDLKGLLSTHRGYRLDHAMLNCVYRPFTANVFPARENMHKIIRRLRQEDPSTGRLWAMIYPLPMNISGPRLGEESSYTSDWFMDLLERSSAPWQFAISSLSPNIIFETSPESLSRRVPGCRERAYALLLQRLLWKVVQTPYLGETELVMNTRGERMGLRWHGSRLTCVSASQATHVCLMPPMQ
jgi:hypothetical protein